jgi:hypothetical protein
MPDDPEDDDPEEEGSDSDSGSDSDADSPPVSVDESVFGSRDEYPDAEDDDFEDDAGDWTPQDYAENARALFGTHESFGETAHDLYVRLGYSPFEESDAYLRQIEQHAPGSSLGLRFYRQGDRIVPRGFLTTAALALLRAAFPALDFSEVNVTVPSRPRDDNRQPPAELPSILRDVNQADKVDLRKYCTPIGNQGQTSRCAAFAWTHALEMGANILGKPVPRLACSFTMLQFQKRQGDFKDFKYAYEGGDGTAGTWEPGQVLVESGTCRHDLWDNDAPHPKAPLEQLFDDAKSQRLEATVFDVGIEDLKRVLTAGCPVQVSMATGDAFQDIGADGVYRAPEKPKGRHGYHAMLCVGYVGNFFIVKNSWGEDWGDKGYCYIPKQVLVEAEPDFTAIQLVRGGAAAPGPGGSFKGNTARPPAPAEAQDPGGPMSYRGGTQQMPALRLPVPGPAAAPAPAPASVAPATPIPAGWVPCPTCRVVTPVARYCTACGSVLEKKKFCADCGHELRANGKFCEGCGAKVPG